MNVYDLAHNLARGLKNSPEYKKYQEALTKIKGNKEREEILTDIRKKQIEIQTLQMMGKEVPQEKLRELEKASEILNLHPSLKEFMDAEFQLSRIMNDIYKILGEAIDLWQPEMK